jgi:hypothetical protein
MPIREIAHAAEIEIFLKCSLSLMLSLQTRKIIKNFNNLNIPLKLSFMLTVFIKVSAPMTINAPKIITGTEAEHNFSFFIIFSIKNEPAIMPITVLATPGAIATENGSKMIDQ